jgi:hypothetical protein
MIFESSFGHIHFPSVEHKTQQKWCFLFAHVERLAIAIHMAITADIK